MSFQFFHNHCCAWIALLLLPVFLSEQPGLSDNGTYTQRDGKVSLDTMITVARSQLVASVLRLVCQGEGLACELGCQASKKGLNLAPVFFGIEHALFGTADGQIPAPPKKL